MVPRVASRGSLVLYLESFEVQKRQPAEHTILLAWKSWLATFQGVSLCSRSSSQCDETFTLPPLGIHSTRGAFPPGVMLLALGLGFFLTGGILALIVPCPATLPDEEFGDTYPSELSSLGDSLQSYTQLLDGPFQGLRAEAGA